MWAVVALVAVCGGATAAVVLLARSAPQPVEPPWDLGDNARKMVTIAGGLAAYSITGVVLLLSFARQPGGIGTPLSSAIGMFLVAFMSLVASGLMFGNLTRPGVVSSGVDVQSLQYSLTWMMFFRSIFLGWLALRPLVEAYGFEELAEQIGWLLFGVALLGGLTLSVAILHRLALVRARVILLVPVLALTGCGLIALLFEVWFDAARSDTSALYLSYALFALNGLSFVFYAVVPTALEHPRSGPVIARWWRPGMAALAVTSAITIGFIWLATAGLI